VVGRGEVDTRPSRDYLHKEGAIVTCFDRKEAGSLGAAYEEHHSLGVGWRLGDVLPPGTSGF
jgi:hypothetical protein